MNPILTDELAARLGEFATATFGLRFPPDRWNELARGAASAALELGIPDPAGWVAAMVNGAVAPGQIRALGNHLTVSETYFFRHREVFAALAERILPERLAVRQAQSRPVRIWSAGCASGEEPYSIALLLRRLIPPPRPEAVVIHGTDMSAPVLARAMRGVYSEWSFRDAPEWLKDVGFIRRPDRRYEILPAIRRSVRFSHLNLAEAYYPGEFGQPGAFDVILCRNVLMYFSGEWQDRTVRRLSAALAPGGWLITGPCDIPNSQCAEYGLRADVPGIFRRRDGAASMSLPSWEPLPDVATWAAFSSALPGPPPEAVGTGSVTAAAPAHEAAPAASGLDESVRAQGHADRGELEAALAACDAALARDRLNPDFHYLRACVLQEQGRTTEAEAAFRRVIYLDPGSVMAPFALGCLAGREGRRPEAQRHFEAVLRLLERRNRGEAVPGADGLTVGRLHAVVTGTLTGDAA